MNPSWRLAWLELVRALASVHGNDTADDAMLEVLYGEQADAALRWVAAASGDVVREATAYATACEARP